MQFKMFTARQEQQQATWWIPFLGLGQVVLLCIICRLSSMRVLSNATYSLLIFVAATYMTFAMGRVGMAISTPCVVAAYLNLCWLVAVQWGATKEPAQLVPVAVVLYIGFTLLVLYPLRALRMGVLLYVVITAYTIVWVRFMLSNNASIPVSDEFSLNAYINVSLGAVMLCSAGSVVYALYQTYMSSKDAPFDRNQLFGPMAYCLVGFIPLGLSAFLSGMSGMVVLLVFIACCIALVAIGIMAGVQGKRWIFAPTIAASTVYVLGLLHTKRTLPHWLVSGCKSVCKGMPLGSMAQTFVTKSEEFWSPSVTHVLMAIGKVDELPKQRPEMLLAFCLVATWAIIAIAVAAAAYVAKRLFRSEEIQPLDWGATRDAFIKRFGKVFWQREKVNAGTYTVVSRVGILWMLFSVAGIGGSLSLTHELMIADLTVPLLAIGISMFVAVYTGGFGAVLTAPSLIMGWSALFAGVLYNLTDVSQGGVSPDVSSMFMPLFVLSIVLLFVVGYAIGGVFDLLRNDFEAVGVSLVLAMLGIPTLIAVAPLAYRVAITAVRWVGMHADGRQTWSSSAHTLLWRAAQLLAGVILMLVLGMLEPLMGVASGVVLVICCVAMGVIAARRDRRDGSWLLIPVLFATTGALVTLAVTQGESVPDGMQWLLGLAHHLTWLDAGSGVVISLGSALFGGLTETVLAYLAQMEASELPPALMSAVCAQLMLVTLTLVTWAAATLTHRLVPGKQS